MNKTFIYHDIPSLVQINNDGRRLYQTPTGEKYPSVTSIMSWYNYESIQAWRKRVGDEEANKVSARASKRGTATHTLCENYILGTPKQPDMFDIEMFNTLVPHLDRINNIHALETRLYSHKLKAAGTTDCIAEYDGKLCVIDFKSSLKVKEKSHIGHYFMQCSAYGYMFWELTGVLVKDICVIIGVDNHPAIVYKEPLKPWLEEFIKVRKNYSLFEF